MRTHPIVKCSKPLAANASAAPLDVVKMKSALGALGHYEAPDWGVSQFPDVALFDAIKAFQKSQGLKVDGAIKPDGETEAALSQAMTPRRAQTALQATAQALQSLGRGGDELLAHITLEEAALLHRVTDGATINPQTGLLEFRVVDAEYDRPDQSGSGGKKEGSGDGGFDPSADHKANQNGSNPQSTPDNHGRGQGDDANGGAKGNGGNAHGASGAGDDSLMDKTKTNDKVKQQRNQTRRAQTPTVSKGSLFDPKAEEDEYSPSRSLFDSIIDGIKSRVYDLMGDDEEEKKNSPYVGGLRG